MASPRAARGILTRRIGKASVPGARRAITKLCATRRKSSWSLCDTRPRRDQAVLTRARRRTRCGENILSFGSRPPSCSQWMVQMDAASPRRSDSPGSSRQPALYPAQKKSGPDEHSRSAALLYFKFASSISILISAAYNEPRPLRTNRSSGRLSPTRSENTNSSFRHSPVFFFFQRL
jgi:hypothetical protein